MKKIWQLLCFLTVLPLAAPASAETSSGVITVPSHHSVDETVNNLKTILQSKGVTLFAVFDDSGAAAKVGLTMPPTKLLIFGSPAAGTPLMLATQSIAIDMPLKILVWQDVHGKVWLSYNSPEYLARRHGLPQNLVKPLTVVAPLAEQAGK